MGMRVARMAGLEILGLTNFVLFFGVPRDSRQKSCENVVADHLSRITPPPFNLADAIKENFPDESLFSVLKFPWYANIVNYLAVKKLPEHWSKQQKNYFFSQLKYYIWEDPELYKMCADQVIRRCVPDHEHVDILAHCHSYACGG
ncbi:hypothetical protein Tco_0630027 [Tanacetum coccineum]